MRGVVQGLVALMLVGCSRDNPWFVLNTAGALDSEGSPSGGTTGDGSSHGEAASAAISSTSGDEGSTAAGASSSTSTSTTSSTTTTGEPGTSSTSTSDSGLGSSSDGSTSTDGTTGEPGEKVLLDLYADCMAGDVVWGNDDGTYGCKGDANSPLSVRQANPIFNGGVVDAILTYPLQEPGKFLEGTYPLTIAGANHPYFRTMVWIPVPADPTDILKASVFPLDQDMVPLGLGQQIDVAAGIPTLLDLDMKDLVGQIDSVALHVQIEVVNSKAGNAKAYWIDPKVIDLP